MKGGWDLRILYAMNWGDNNEADFMLNIGNKKIEIFGQGIQLTNVRPDLKKTTTYCKSAEYKRDHNNITVQLKPKRSTTTNITTTPYTVRALSRHNLCLLIVSELK
jgi:hypothetical protein